MNMQTDSKQTEGAVAVRSGDLFCLSVRQPWAWLILHAGKDIENRTWPTRFRGRVLIHASKGMTLQEYDDAAFTLDSIYSTLQLPMKHELQRGGIVGEVEIVDCVGRSDSPWFFGEYGFVLRNPKALEFEPCKGALGFFKAQRQNGEVSEVADADSTKTSGVRPPLSLD